MFVFSEKIDEIQLYLRDVMILKPVDRSSQAVELDFFEYSVALLAVQLRLVEGQAEQTVCLAPIVDSKLMTGPCSTLALALASHSILVD